MEQLDEFAGLRAGYYANLAAHEYIHYGSVFKAIDPTRYSGYEAHLYVDEYYEANPIAIISK